MIIKRSVNTPPRGNNGDSLTRSLKEGLVIESVSRRFCWCQRLCRWNPYKGQPKKLGGPKYKVPVTRSYDHQVIKKKKSRHSSSLHCGRAVVEVGNPIGEHPGVMFGVTLSMARKGPRTWVNETVSARRGTGQVSTLRGKPAKPISGMV